MAPADCVQKSALIIQPGFLLFMSERRAGRASTQACIQTADLKEQASVFLDPEPEWGGKEKQEKQLPFYFTQTIIRETLLQYKSGKSSLCQTNMDLWSWGSTPYWASKKLQAPCFGFRSKVN